MKRGGKVCRALHVRGSWGEYISSPHPTETVGTYETAYRSIRGIIMETKEKEQKDEKKSDTTPKPLKAIASAPAVQAVESMVQKGVPQGSSCFAARHHHSFAALLIFRSRSFRAQSRLDRIQ